MLTLAEGKKDGKEFISHAPGYFSGGGRIAPELWNDWKWQLKNRVTTLAQLEQHLTLSDEERAGVLLSGDKLALAVTPHFFNLIEADDPDCPIRRQVIPRVEETWTSPYDMGVDGLRLDAIPYLYEREGTNCENLPETHEYLKRLRAHVEAKFPGRMLLAEANQWPEDAVEYFGEGDESHMQVERNNICSNIDVV